MISYKKKKNTIVEAIKAENPPKDTSPIVHQRGKLKSELHIFERELTPKQVEFVKLAMDKDTKCIICSGPAGSTKTFLAIYVALKLLSFKRVSDLIYLRSAVESSDKSIGFLPGEISEKLSPYMQPLLDKLTEFLPKAEIELLMKEHRIENIPIGFLRGLSWNAKAVVIDEAQDMSFKELQTAMTRIGEFSKVIILGDPDQTDIHNSGFMKIYDGFNTPEDKEHGIHTFAFTEEDCVRSAFVKYILGKLKKLSKY